MKSQLLSSRHGPSIRARIGLRMGHIVPADVEVTSTAKQPVYPGETSVHDQTT
jgi:hypothetical protein